MRATVRLLALFLWTVLVSPAALVELTLRVTSRGRMGARLLHLWSRGACFILGVRIRTDGVAPAGPHLFASNHLGYLDILILSAVYPTHFLSMAEVARWPLVGPLASLVGTLFIDRSRRSDVERAGSQVARHLAQGLPVTVFPEGKASSGATVGHFHSSLFEAAVEAQVPCVPVSLSVDAPGALEPASTLVCWWGEASFAPHFARLLRVRRIEAHVRFGDAVAPAADRKTLARAVHAQVLARFRPVAQSSLQLGVKV